MNIKKYFNFIFESFDSKNYIWSKSVGCHHQATFIINNRKYVICFDEILNNGYNHYFFMEENDNKHFNIMKYNDGSSIKIFSNIKHATIEFILKNNIDFIGFSAEEDERKELYHLYAQSLKNIGNLDQYMSKSKNNKEYYFIYNSESLIPMLRDKYIERFIIESDKKMSDLKK